MAATLIEAAQIARLLGDITQAVAYLDRVASLRTEAGDLRGAASAFIKAAHALLEGRRPVAARSKLRAAGLLLGEEGNDDLIESELCEGERIEAEDVSFGSKAETGDAIDDLSLADWCDAKNAFARRYLKAVLERVQGNVSQAARETGMKRQAFQRLLNRHEVSPVRYRLSRELQGTGA